jgi:phosphoribosyl-AMP cyclohydrolase
MGKIEVSKDLCLDFTKLKKVAALGDFIPAIAQDIETNTVLIIGYVNNKALDYALANKVATFWSTSRNELWVKGKTSGDMLELVEVLVNCEQNSIVYRVKMTGKAACHAKDENGEARFSCFYRKISAGALEFIESD